MYSRDWDFQRSTLTYVNFRVSYLYVKNKIPKIIWIYWKQGESNAPLLVSRCISSWKRENPEWTIKVLNNDSVAGYIDITSERAYFEKLTIAHQSDLIRLFLLSKYGGVWVDATLFCVRPIDPWIHEKSHSGIFVFCNPGPDRVMANWFIASEKGNPIITKLSDKLTLFYMQNGPNLKINDKCWKVSLLGRLLNRSTSTTKYWFSPIATKIFRAYPYFVFHYLFEVIISKGECRTIWDRSSKISADGPHALQEFGLLSTVDENIKIRIDSKLEPMYKLSWKYKLEECDKDSVLYYLLNR